MEQEAEAAPREKVDGWMSRFFNGYKAKKGKSLRPLDEKSHQKLTALTKLKESTKQIVAMALAIQKQQDNKKTTSGANITTRVESGDINEVKKNRDELLSVSFLRAFEFSCCDSVCVDTTRQSLRSRV
jgi:hypothetical protein